MQYYKYYLDINLLPCVELELELLLVHQLELEHQIILVDTLEDILEVEVTMMVEDPQQE